MITQLTAKRGAQPALDAHRAPLTLYWVFWLFLIPKLPGLRDQFMAAYVKVLEVEQAPVLDSIDQARKRVLDALSGKEYEAQKRSHYFEQFQEIWDGAEHCNNVSTLRSFGDKADALKLRLLGEMDALDAQIAQKKAEAAAKQAREQAEKAGSEAQIGRAHV